MGLPSITIIFQTAARAVSRRGGQGSVGLIVLDDDTATTGKLLTLKTAADIPATLSETNRQYIAQAFVGNVNSPSVVYACVLAADETSYADALAEFSKLDLDWVAGDPAATATLAGEIKTWVEDARDDANSVVKAVLPGVAADSEWVVNFAAEDIAVGSKTYAAAGYCARIAGLLAGTPLWQSATYATLPEVEGLKRKTRSALDAEVEAGKLVLFHDGAKVKVGRGVTSLTTTSADKPALLKKIKAVEALDLIRRELRTLVQDEYIGKYANSYDNKCILITAVKSYLDALEDEGILQAGQSSVSIDTDAQRTYLAAQGVDVSRLSESEIRQADTGDKVFLLANVRLLDAIEDVQITVNYAEV